MDWKRVLGLALASVALALVVWGLLFAKMTTVSIKVDLPPAAPARPASKPIDIFITPEETIQVNGKPSSLDTLARDVAAASTLRDKSQQQVMIRAGETVTYGTYTAVLERLRGAGWSKVGVVKD
ncbi:MAG: biopolymer transporter ExbD [Caulobacter sp.]|nr:biopolymer transporter ExbD [Caulobacter sp.]